MTTCPSCGGVTRWLEAATTPAAIARLLTTANNDIAGELCMSYATVRRRIMRRCVVSAASCARPTWDAMR